MATLQFRSKSDGPPFKVSDPRVQRRLHAALTWAEKHLSADQPVQVSKRKLSAPDALGQQQNTVSQWLRVQLLRPVGGYVVGERAISYTLREEGVEKIRTLLGLEPETRAERLSRVFADQLATHEYAYHEAAYRLWHPLQNLKKTEREAFWQQHGLPYTYDINACAPTVVLQLATKLGLPKLLSKPIQDYVSDKSSLRQHVASLAGVDAPTAKMIINSLFNGARLVPHDKAVLFVTLDRDREALEALKSDERVQELLRAIKACWTRITERVQIEKADRWALYFREERRILDAVREYCAENGVAIFTLHDGWRTNRELDVPAVQARIKEKTGYDVTID